MPGHHKNTGSPMPVDVSWKQPKNLADLLVRAASGDHGSIYIGSDGRELRRSFRELLALSGRMACGLRSQNLKPGSAVILQAPENELFYAALQACFQAGLVAVPVAVPELWVGENASLIRLEQAWQMLDQAPILTSAALAEEIKKGLGEDANILTDEMLLAAPDSLHCPDPDPDAIALMMLTSGSTGRPKLVTQTHRAILAQAGGQGQLLNLSEKDVFFNWIPSDHVGSLIMIHTQALFLGASEVHVNKQTILDQPLLWLDLMDRHRATFSWAPCFAYGLINRELEEGGKTLGSELSQVPDQWRGNDRGSDPATVCSTVGTLWSGTRCGPFRLRNVGTMFRGHLWHGSGKRLQDGSRVGPVGTTHCRAGPAHRRCR